MMPAILPALRYMAVELINSTPDGTVGYTEAADAISEDWDRWQEAGATTEDLEQITGFIRAAKFEGFCSTAPMRV